MAGASGATAEVFLGMNVKKFIAGAKKGMLASKDLMDKFAANQQRMRNMSLKTGVALGAQVLWLHKVTQAAATQETVEKKLADAVLKHEGATMATVTALKEQAAALQKVTKYGDEATIEAQALLATYGVIPENLKAATEATLDFAAATGRDLKTAALTVGKAVGAGFTGELSRYGIILDTSTIPKTEVAAAILQKLNDQFGGRAQQEAETYAGRMERLKNAAGDLNEKLGMALIPTIEKLIAKLQPIIERTADWVSQNQDLVAAIVGIGVGGTGLVFGLSTMGYLLAGLPMLIGALISPMGIMVAGVLAVAGALAYLQIRGRALPGTLEELDAEIDTQRSKLDKLHGAMAAIDFKTPKDDAGQYVDTLKQIEYEDLARQAALLEERLKKLTEAKKILFEQDERERQAKLMAATAMPITPEGEMPGGAPSPFPDEAEIGWTLETLNAATSDWAEQTKEKIAEVQAEWRALYDEKAVGVASAFFGSVEGMYAHFHGVVGKTIVGSAIEALKAVIDAYMAAEIGKATIGAALSFGATLAAIGPILAAGTAAKAALSAVMGAMKSYEYGGIIKETGVAYVHKGERVINPAHPESYANAGMAGNINQSVAFYGPLNHKIDIADASYELARRTRLAMNGGI